MKKEDYFVRVPVSILLDKRLTRSSVLLYAVLLDKANQYGMSNCTIGELAVESGLSPHTVRRSERQLVDAGLLEIERTGRASLLILKGHTLDIKEYSALDSHRREMIKEVIGI